MKKPNEYEKKMDSMLNESFKKTSKAKADAKWDKQIKKIRSTGGTKSHTFTESDNDKWKNTRIQAKNIFRMLYKKSKNLDDMKNGLKDIIKQNKTKPDQEKVLWDEFNKYFKLKGESVNEEADDTLMLKIGGEQGKYWPWYFKKIDSTHFKMANNEKALNSGAAMVSHVGQHRGDAYYSTLVDWLHNKIKTKQIFGKKFEGNG